jgi:hypothetical protein
MREDDNKWSSLGPDAQEMLLQKYFAWTDDLKARNAFVTGAPIGTGGRLLRLTEGQVVETPFRELKQVLTGYFIIEAADLTAATEIARTCPALIHGETVELRPVGKV